MFFPILSFFFLPFSLGTLTSPGDPNNNEPKNYPDRGLPKPRNNPHRGLPEIQISTHFDEFEMPPLETMSPFDYMENLKEEKAFFMGTIDNFKHALQPSLDSISVSGESTGGSVI